MDATDYRRCVEIYGWDLIRWPGMTDDEAWRRIHAAEDLWIARSRRDWTLDLNILTDAGITLARPDSAAERRATAQRKLNAVHSAPLPRSPTIPPPVAPANRPPAASAQLSGPRPTIWWRRLLGRR